MTLIVASIDFGTTFSGWAYSSKSEFQKDPLHITTKQWHGGNGISEKGPTCVLIKPDGRTLDSFGYEAENKYTELARDKKHKPWYYFRRFKMMLFDKIGIQRNIQIEDVSGKPLPAQRVFTLSIKYLKDDLMEMIEKQITGLTTDDIHWVLTVPAIWNDAAKQFMREAAVEAGIADSKLSIALEPECASLYCQHVEVEKRADTSLDTFKPGTKYIVVDAGGGTVDITAHEVISKGKLKELHKASGGAWGGTKVDDAYGEFLEEITAPGLMGRLKERYMEDYVDIFREFETKKKEITSEYETRITMRTPINMVQLIKKMTGGKSMAEAIQRSSYGSIMTHEKDKLRMESGVIVELFDKPVRSVTRHVSSLLKEPSVKGCQTILMVGGFTDSPVLQDAMKTSFPKMKFIIPKEAGLAVIKGAVIMGHSPRAISERICRYTYGTKVSHEYDEVCEHRVGRREHDDRRVLLCKDIFDIHVRAGQAVKLREEQVEKIACPINDKQKRIGCAIYMSDNSDPHLVTEEGCTRIGTLSVPITDKSLGRNREFGTTFLFGGTEIKSKLSIKQQVKHTKQKLTFWDNFNNGMFAITIITYCHLCAQMVCKC